MEIDFNKSRVHHNRDFVFVAYNINVILENNIRSLIYESIIISGGKRQNSK